MVYFLFLFRYRRLVTIGAAPTALSWQLSGENNCSDCAIATADGHIRGLTTNHRSGHKILAVEKGHDPLLPANWLSANSSGTILVSSSLDAAILWDTSNTTWHKIRRLVMRQQIDMSGALFVPMSDFLVTAFSDGTVLVWQPDTLHLAFRLPAHTKPSSNTKMSPSSIAAKNFTASADGRWLCACEGEGCRLLIWQLDAKVPKSRGPRVVNMATWLPSSATAGTVQSLTAMGKSSSVGSLMIALVDHSILLGVDVELARPSFVVDPLLGNDIPDCHSISQVSFMPFRISNGKMAVLSAHSGSLFLIAEPNSLVEAVTGIKKPEQKQMKKNRQEKKDSERHLRLSKHQEQQLNEMSGIERSALVQLLKHYGAFPNRLRPLVWRLLLKLPRNHGAFQTLLDRGPHPCVSGLAERYPVRSAKLFRLLARTLSCLAHWSPIFGETDFLPMFIFPFLHVFESDPMTSFELIATLLIGFCQHWFEYAPHPPIAVLSAVENLLAHADQRLLLHLTAHQMTAQDYAWPLLQTAFSEILAGADWLRVWDHCLANGPAFFVAFPVAYLVSARAALFRLTDRDEFQFFMRNRNAVDIDRVIAETNSLLTNAPYDVHPVNSAKIVSDINDFCMPVGPAYPVFDRYPKYVINFRTEERERLRKDLNDDKLAAFDGFDNERKQRFVAMEHSHGREDISLAGAYGNESLKPMYRGAKLQTGLSSALENIEMALEEIDLNNDEEEKSKALLRNAAKQLLEAVENREPNASPKKYLNKTPQKSEVADARDKLRSCVSALRRDLHRRKLIAEQPH